MSATNSLLWGGGEYGGGRVLLAWFFDARSYLVNSNDLLRCELIASSYGDRAKNSCSFGGLEGEGLNLPIIYAFGVLTGCDCPISTPNV